MEADQPIQSTLEILIGLKDVTVESSQELGKNRVLGWNWSVRENQIWILGGTAGSGKTELLSVASGLIKPRSGSVSLFGKEVQDLEPEAWLEEKLKLGLVFEDGGRVFQDLSVYDNLMLPLAYHELPDTDKNHAWVTQILEMMGMSSMLNRLAGRLSRNWRQRLGLARAMVLRPEVLFLDNPLGVVDSHHGQWWLEFLDSLVHGDYEWKPKSIVVSASDLKPWLDRSNCLAMIHDGDWVEMDPSDRDTLNRNPLVRALSTGINQPL